MKTFVRCCGLAAALTWASADGAASAALLDSSDLKVGRIVREGDYLTLNLALKSHAGRFVTSVSVDCTALDDAGQPLDTAPTAFDNVKDGATVYEQAIFKGLSGSFHFDCRVVEYSE